ncbi:dihydrolipoyl dehydrogenase [Clostridium sp. DL1XJH146]
MNNDIIVIGGGPGGYVAAIRAAQLGARVCLIEKDKIGGTCLNRGCIPTKALYRNAEILNTLKNIDEFGININEYSVDIEKVQKRKNEVISKLVGGVEQLLQANNIEVIKGTASFIDKNTISVMHEDKKITQITGTNVIIASGSSPSIPPIEGADIEGIYTSENILNFNNIPKSLTVIGGGVIGMELACIFNSFGTEVTVIEYLPEILAQIDTDITKRLTSSLKRKGIKINTSTKVNSIEKIESGYTITCVGKKGELKVRSEKVLVSAGRAPYFDNLNLEALSVDFDSKGIKTDSDCATNIPGIYAIGDVTGGLMLAHAASHEGIKAVEKIMGYSNASDSTVIPSCIFIFPEIASAGLTEKEAKEKEISYKVSKFMFGANGKALALGEPEGFVKVLSSNEIIIGVHIMGPHASDLIHEGTLAITKELKIDDIINTVHAHPTLAESFTEAVMGLKGQAIHMVPPKK